MMVNIRFISGSLISRLQGHCFSKRDYIQSRTKVLAYSLKQNNILKIGPNDLNFFR